MRKISLAIIILLVLTGCVAIPAGGYANYGYGNAPAYYGGGYYNPAIYGLGAFGMGYGLGYYGGFGDYHHHHGHHDGGDNINNFNNDGDVNIGYGSNFDVGGGGEEGDGGGE